MVTSFGFKKVTEKPTTEKVRVLVENTEFLDHEALILDEELFRELVQHEGFDGHPLGIVLLSSNSICKLCGGNLLVRADRPSFLTGYTNSLGTVPVTHFRKYCNKARTGCSFTQHYGFHTFGEGTDVTYDENWADLPYFVSTYKTAFEMSMLKAFNAEVLIGQVSYNQRCDVYNYIHGYEDRHKTAPKEKRARESTSHKAHANVCRYALSCKLHRNNQIVLAMDILHVDTNVRYRTLKLHLHTDFLCDCWGL